MKELLCEYDCFISVESSKNLQLINHSDVKNYDECSVINASYRHKVPDVQMTIEHPNFENFSKTEFTSTESKLFTEPQSSEFKSSYIIYLCENSAYFVPISRPILKSYLANDISTEYSKQSKKSGNVEYQQISERKQSLIDFQNLRNQTFTPLSATDKILQPWIPVHYHSFNENVEESRRLTLLCYKRERLFDILSPENPIQKILHQLRDINKKKAQSYSSQMTTSLETEILNILIEDNVMGFNRLMELLKDRRNISTNQLSEKAVLKYLPKLAILVRGLWVIKSEILYKLLPLENISSDQMCLARDYVLCVFRHGNTLTTKKLQSITKLPSVEATNLLHKLSMRISSKDSKTLWKFPDVDNDFINKNQSVNIEQIHMMDQKEFTVRQKYNVSMTGDACHPNQHNHYRRRTVSLPESKIDMFLLSPDKRKRQSDMPIDSSMMVDCKRSRQNSTSILDCRSTVLRNVDEDADNNDSVLASINRNNLNVMNNANNNGDIPVSMDMDFQGLDENVTDMQPEQQYVKQEPSVWVNNIKSEAIQDPLSSEASPTKSEEEPMEIGNNQSSSNFLDESNSVSNTNEHPSDAVVQDIKQFVLEQLRKTSIIPVADLSHQYQENFLNKLPSSDLGRWSSMDTNSLNKEIQHFIINILNEASATRIDVTWPTVNASLLIQDLYLSNNAEVRKDHKLIEKILLVLRSNNGCFVINKLKDALKADPDTRKFADKDVLKHRVKNYCQYNYRKYFLQHTVRNPK